MIRRRVASTFCLLVGLSLSAVRAEEEFRGFIVDTAGAVRGKTADSFVLHVDQYTTVEEAQALANLLLGQGPEAVLKELRKLDQGWIKVGARLGYPIGLVRTIDSEDGRLIRAVTDRPIQMFELMRNTRSSDHEFGLLEIKLDAEGKGNGQLIAAAKVSITKDGQVEIESMGTRPFSLNSVKLQKKKVKAPKADGG